MKSPDETLQKWKRWIRQYDTSKQKSLVLFRIDWLWVAIKKSTIAYNAGQLYERQCP